MTHKRCSLPLVAAHLSAALLGCVADDTEDPVASLDELPAETALIATADGVREIGFQRLGDGTVLVEGDILLTEEEIDDARVELDKDGVASAAVRTAGSARWPNGVIPFVIDAGLPNQARVTTAIAHWEANTPFRFVARTNQTDFVRFVAGTGCSSPVGKRGGRQDITLDTGCSTGATIHEIGHAIGFWHEQTRRDRNSFVTVNTGCIQADAAHNFTKYVDRGEDGEDTGPYDYGSIMHYGAFSFSNAPGCATLTQLLPGVTMGQRTGLSPGDILAAHRIRHGSRPGVKFLPGDFDGDGLADLSIKDDTGVWRIDYAANGFGTWGTTVSAYGNGTVTPLPADYDGDGKTDLSVKDTGGYWHIDYAADGFGAWNQILGGYGGTWATAVPADYDGDGKADLSVKDTNGYWHIDYAAGGFGAWNLILGGYGGTWATPLPADYDGDGKADLSVKDTNGYWHIDRSSDGFGGWNQIVGGYGNGVVTPVPADYDGDGKADLSIKDTGGTWHIDYAIDGFVGWNQLHYGYGSTSTPLPADYDGDGKADLSVRDGTGVWFIDYAANTFAGWDWLRALGV